MSLRFPPAVLSVLAAVLVAAEANAQSAPSGISVTGMGEVRAKPNVLEIDLYASGAAELSGDAVVKFRDVKKRVREAFAAMKVPNLEVVEKSVSITSGEGAERTIQMMRGMASTTQGKTRVAVGAVQQLRIKGIRDMSPEKLLELVSRLVDTARDSGGSVGMTAEDSYQAYRNGTAMETSMVRFVLEDTADLQKEAYRKAVASAESRAKEIADLTRVKVGEILSVEDATNAPKQMGTQVYYYNQYRSKEEPPEGKLFSDKFGEISVSVRLNVRFAIAK